MLDFIKEKSYYLLGGTVLLLVIIIVVASCSSGKKISSYEQIEQKMVNAATKYYTNNPNLLPKEEGGKVKINVSTLVEAELLSEIVDFKNKNSVCSGSVEVVKVGEEYSYIPFLRCPNNYEPEYLVDVIKNSSLDEYDNGVYQVSGEYIYRGDDVNNYVLFNNQVWRIIKIDKDGDIKLVYYPEKKYNKTKCFWDNKYNSEIGKSYGVTTDYLHSNIRKELINFYKENFDKDSKAKIISKNICVGPVSNSNLSDMSSECYKIEEKEVIGLLQVSDYYNSSLEQKCSWYGAPECVNRNYLSKSDINTWLLTPVLENTHEVYYLNSSISSKKASSSNKMYPVIYINGDVVVSGGSGTQEDMYIIK